MIEETENDPKPQQDTTKSHQEPQKTTTNHPFFALFAQNQPEEKSNKNEFEGTNRPIPNAFLNFTTLMEEGEMMGGQGGLNPLKERRDKMMQEIGKKHRKKKIVEERGKMIDATILCKRIMPVF